MESLAHYISHPEKLNRETLYELRMLVAKYPQLSGKLGSSALDLSKFDTQNVTNLSRVFYDCKNLVEVDVSNFSLDNTTDLSATFFGCEKLSRIVIKLINNDLFIIERLEVDK